MNLPYLDCLNIYNLLRYSQKIVFKSKICSFKIPKKN